MVKKTLLSIAIAASVASIAGCNVSSTDKYDNKIDSAPVEAGKPGQPQHRGPIFLLAAKTSPLFNDLILPMLLLLMARLRLMILSLR